MRKAAKSMGSLRVCLQFVNNVRTYDEESDDEDSKDESGSIVETKASVTMSEESLKGLSTSHCTRLGPSFRNMAQKPLLTLTL